MNHTFDVIVVGAGSAGASAALQCARRGLHTLLADKRPLDRAGARWVNGIFARAFDEAEIARPVAPELRSAGCRFHLVAGWGPHAMVFGDTGVIDVDMGALVDRLQADAARAGAELRGSVAVTRVAPGVVDFADGSRAQARVVIDASGLGGLYRSEKPVPGDVCAAAQGVYAVRDRAAAHRFFAGFGAAPGETVCFAAVAGGYSIVSARLEGDDELSVLTGSLPALGHPAGKALRDAFAGRHTEWIGGMRFGGHAPIPLHRPRRRLAFVLGDGAAKRAIVRIGDAAGQVYAVHGSGVGAQLVASHMLASELALHGAGGAKRWERAWHRRFGPKFLIADLVRRASTPLGPRGLARLMQAGLLPAQLIRFGMAAGL